MFALFFSLYYSMFIGRWQLYTLNDFLVDGRDVKVALSSNLNAIGQFLTSIFGDNTMNDFGTAFLGDTNGYIHLIAFILALITSIGIVVMAVKGVKRAFGIFFMGIR